MFAIIRSNNWLSVVCSVWEAYFCTRYWQPVSPPSYTSSGSFVLWRDSITSMQLIRPRRPVYVCQIHPSFAVTDSSTCFANRESLVTPCTDPQRNALHRPAMRCDATRRDATRRDDFAPLCDAPLCDAPLCFARFPVTILGREMYTFTANSLPFPVVRFSTFP